MCNSDYQDKQCYVTVITATYQRLEKLKMLYASLVAQSSHAFEWVVVDDGSTDDSAKWLESLIEKSPFSIQVISKTNGGKHTALNRAFEIAKGRYAIMVDSDDTLIPQAITEIHRLGAITDKYHSEARQKGGKPICGFTTPIIASNGSRISLNTPQNATISDFVSLRFRSKVLGDMSEVLRIKYLRQFRFPEFAGEKFFPETYLFASLALHFKVMYFDTPLLVRSYDKEGLSAKFVQLMIESPLAVSTTYCLLASHPRQTFKGRQIARTLFWTYTFGSSIPWRRRLKLIGIRALPHLIPASILRTYYCLYPKSKPLL